MTRSFWLDLKRPPINALDEQRQKICEFQMGEAVDVVIVGTSLSQHLRPEYFSSIRVRNLSLPGGSALTGLEIVANSHAPPQIVLVEVNLLYKAKDSTMVSSFRARSKTAETAFFLLRDLKPMRSLLATYLKTPAIPDIMIKRVPSQSRKDYYRQMRASVLSETTRATASQEQQNALGNFFDCIELNKVKASAEEAKRCVDLLVAQGTQVIFFEMPAPPPLACGRYMGQIREIFGEAKLPNSTYWRIGCGNYSKYTWPDAMHLDAKSAILLCPEIEQLLIEALEKRISDIRK